MAGEDNLVYITQEGLQKLKDELNYLKGPKREEIAVKLQIAISQGDLKENADYHAAKEEQGFVEGRIRELQDSISRAKVIADVGPANVVRVGSTVTVVEEGYDEPETYYIVGAHEADPSKGRISNESPFGKALIGAKRGQVVTVQSPQGMLRLQVQAIK